MAWAESTGNLEIAREEDGEASVVEEVEHGQHASRNHSSLLDHAERHNGFLGELGVPDEEDADDNDSDDQHGNVSALVPSIATPGPGEGEGNQSETEADDKKGGAEDVEVDPEEVDETLAKRLRLVGSIPGTFTTVTVLAGLALKDVEGDDEGCSAEGEDDGPHSVSPPPGRVLEDAVGDDGSNVQSRDGGDGLGEGCPETSVDEAGGVGDEDLRHDAESSVTDGLEDASGLKLLIVFGCSEREVYNVGVNVLAGSVHDLREDEEEDGTGETLSTAKDLGLSDDGLQFRHEQLALENLAMMGYVTRPIMVPTTLAVVKAECFLNSDVA